MESFAEHGVTSFDSTSSFRQAFMDDRKNYHTLTNTYVALRVPQVDGNPALKRAILSGRVSQREAVHGERECLKALRAFDRDEVDLEEAVATLAYYETLTSPRASYLAEYRRTLQDAPWRRCPCKLCREHGVQIAVFRGTERNKRRGFHNLYVLAARMHTIATLPVRALG
jgi:hypothetical protein